MKNGLEVVKLQLIDQNLIDKTREGYRIRTETSCKILTLKLGMGQGQ
uniref:Uncharacterized protein n=1 Tax=Rhizophora mucronata TaxID=61149 RepID=A0A2P2NSW1_RHIMU